MKMYILVLNDNMQGQKMNSVSIYGILTTKKWSLKNHFIFFCPLHSPIGISLIMTVQM